jgi:hypothetical protein
MGLNTSKGYFDRFKTGVLNISVALDGLLAKSTLSAIQRLSALQKPPAMG